MLAITECKEVLNKGTRRYSEVEVKQIRDLLYRLGMIAERIHDEYSGAYRSSGLVGVMYLGLSTKSKPIQQYFQKHFVQRYCHGHGIPIYQRHQEKARYGNERLVLKNLI